METGVILRLFKVLATAFILCGLQPAFSDDYPSKTIRVIFPGGAGGAGDVLARVIGERFQERTGQSLLVEPRPGGNAVIAMNAVTQSRPDGYTLISNSSVYSGGKFLHKSFTVDVLNDFEHIVEAVRISSYLVVRADSPFKSVGDLIAYGKANPGKLNVGASVGFNMDCAALFHSMSMEVMQVPFAGGNQLAPALMGGNLDLIVASMAPVRALVSDGRLRILAVIAPTRSGIMPDVPAITEAAPTAVTLQIHNGFSAPKGTPRAVIDKLNSEINAILRMPDVRARLSSSLGGDVTGGTPEEWRASQAQVLERYAAAAKLLNLVPQ